MKISANGIDFIGREEGRKHDAYRDEGGVLTIGIGHTGPVPGRGPITETMTVTDREIDDMFRADIEPVEHAVNAAVHYPQITQGQFDALCDLAFEMGAGAMATSTLVKKLNAGDLVGAAAEFGRWNKVRINGVLQYDEGVNMRRVCAVYELFARP